MRYVALGDSYTIGTSVRPDERWPDQLVRRLGAGSGLELVANLGVNGYTSADVIEHELPLLEAHAPDLATLLVGVNDVVQGVPETRYTANVATILDTLLARLPARRILVVATPDYTVTPSGADYGDPELRRAGIERINAIMSEAAAARGIRFVEDVLAISRRAAAEPALVAADGLHPSAAQYALWAAAIEPVVRELVA